MIIYLITNKVNGKQYVGQTIHTLQERWYNHCSKNSGCVALKNAIDKYGKDNFILSVIDTAETQKELDEKECFWINELNTLALNGYNLKTGGEHIVFTDEIRQKISKSLTGKKLSDERKLEISEEMKKQWKSGSRTGHPISEKSRYVLSEYVQKHGSWNKGLPKELQPRYGKPRSIEERQKISTTLSKPVLCVELNKVFNSSQEASKELHIAFPNISHCLHGRRKTAGGYHWRWYNAS